MKKIIVAILVFVLGLTLVSCSENSTQSTGDSSYELALITDLGGIDDKSFNQGSWEGLVKYATEHNISYKYYKPAEQSDDAYLSAIDLAVKGGAKVIVTPGFLFEIPIYEAQDLYPEVHFILVDGSPHNADFSDTKIGNNTVGVHYAEEEAGFLAGYAVVKDGYRNLGFMGGMAVPAVVKFGYGFVQGADYAAQELGLKPDEINIKYHYTGAFEATPEVQSMAAAWYNDETEVIFACGGPVGNSVMAAAEQAGAKVVGVDVDQSEESESVITSATKGLSSSVYNSIADYYNGTFPGGQDITLTAASDGVNLPMDTSRFQTFSQADYAAIYKVLQSGSISLVNDVETSVTDIPVKVTKITVV